MLIDGDPFPKMAVNMTGVDLAMMGSDNHKCGIRKGTEYMGDRKVAEKPRHWRRLSKELHHRNLLHLEVPCHFCNRVSWFDTISERVVDH